MACSVCGSRTSAGSYLCGRCFKRVTEPLALSSNCLDPMADQRINQNSSIILRIGPSFAGELRIGKGLDPRLTFDRMLASEDRSHIPSFIDQNLCEMGIDLFLTGDEMVPRRELVFYFIQNVNEMSFEGEAWAKACLRMGNIVALAAKEARSLPIEPADSGRMMQMLEGMARKFYSASVTSEALSMIGLANQALLDHWLGRSIDAMKVLDSLTSQPPTRFEEELALMKAQVLFDLGRKEEAKAAVGQLPADNARAKRFRTEAAP